MKSLYFGALLLGLIQSAYADGTSLGNDAVLAANLVREPRIAECIKKSASERHALAWITDVRVIDREAEQYEVSLRFRQGDIMLLGVDLSVTSKMVESPWGQPPHRVFQCSVKEKNAEKAVE